MLKKVTIVRSKKVKELKIQKIKAKVALQKLKTKKDQKRQTRKDKVMTLFLMYSYTQVNTLSYCAARASTELYTARVRVRSP
jgi:hypothetical protein